MHVPKQNYWKSSKCSTILGCFCIELKKVGHLFEDWRRFVAFEIEDDQIFFMLSLASFECFSKVWMKPSNTFNCNRRYIFNLYKLDLPIFTNIVLYTHLLHSISYHHSRGKVRLTRNDGNQTGKVQFLT